MEIVQELERRLKLARDNNAKGKSWLGKFLEFYDLMVHSRPHKDALAEAYKLVETLVKLGKVKPFSEKIVSRIRLNHPAYLKAVEQFEKLKSELKAELEQMKRDTGYELVMFPRIVDKEIHRSWKEKKN